MVLQKLPKGGHKVEPQRPKNVLCGLCVFHCDLSSKKIKAWIFDEGRFTALVRTE
jgi:hypothetical protein